MSGETSKYWYVGEWSVELDLVGVYTPKDHSKDKASELLGYFRNTSDCSLYLASISEEQLNMESK
jgi:hypothetical protein